MVLKVSYQTTSKWSYEKISIIIIIFTEYKFIEFLFESM